MPKGRRGRLMQNRSKRILRTAVAACALFTAQRWAIAASRDECTLSYTCEQWRRGDAPGGAGFLAFSYSTSAANILTGSFTSVPQLNFVSPNTGTPTLTALDGNAAGNRTLISFTVGGF